MFFNKLTLKNFRQFRKMEVEFDKLTLISGPTDKGKSTIFKALRLLYTNKTDQNLDELVNWNSDFFEITGIFSYRSRLYEYTIKRTKGGTTTRTLKHGDKKKSNADALEFLNKLYNPVYADYSSVIVQKDNSFFTETETKRRERFKKLFEIDEIDSIGERIGNDIQTLKSELAHNEEKLRNLENTQYGLMEVPLLPDIEKLRIEFDNLSVLKQQQEKYEIYLSTLQIQKEAKERHEKALQNQIEIEAKIDELEKLKKILLERNLSPPEGEKKTLEEQHINLLTEIKNHENELSFAVDGKCPVCQQDYVIDRDHITKELKDLQEELSKVVTSLSVWEDYEIRVNQNTGALSNLVNQIDFYRKQQQVIPPLVIDSSSEISSPPTGYNPSRYEEVHRQILVYEEMKKNIQQIEQFNAKQRELVKKRDIEVSEILTLRDELTHRMGVKTESKKVLETKISPYIMSKGIKFIEDQINEFFQDHTRDYLIKFNSSLGIEFNRNSEHWAPLRSFAGFRQELTNFAFMYAIRQIENPGLLLIDEGESSADSESSQNLYDLIVQDEELNQIIAITHNQETVSYLKKNYDAKVIELC